MSGHLPLFLVNVLKAPRIKAFFKIIGYVIMTGSFKCEYGVCDITSNICEVNLVNFLPFCSEIGTSPRGINSHFMMRRKCVVL